MREPRKKKKPVGRGSTRRPLRGTPSRGTEQKLKSESWACERMEIKKTRKGKRIMDTGFTEYSKRKEVNHVKWCYDNDARNLWD